MAARTAAEVADLLQSLAALGWTLDEIGDWLVYKLGQITTQTEVGDEVPANEAIRRAIATFEAQYGVLYQRYVDMARAAAPEMGRLGTAPGNANADQLASWFQKYLVDNSIEFDNTSLSVGAPSFSGAGDGAMVAASAASDPNGDLIDLGHEGSLYFRCTRDHSEGATAGREEFTVYGTANTTAQGNPPKPWEEGGPGNGRAYNPVYGITDAEFGRSQKRLAQGGKMTSVGPSAGAGNLILNGDFESAISGTGNSKLPDWTFSAGAADVAQSTDGDRINGTYSLEASDDFLMYQDMAVNRLAPRTTYGLTAKVNLIDEATGGATGTFTVKIKNRDDSATLATLTVDLSTLAEDAKGVRTPVLFNVPDTALDLKVEVELASLANGNLVIDDIICGPATLVDGKVVFIADGTTVDTNGNAVGRYKNGDVFTVATTNSVTAPSLMKHLANRAFGRHFRGAASPTANWEDPSGVPLLTFGGTFALGAVATGAHSVDVLITNTGNRPAGIGIPTQGATTNATLTGAGTASPLMLLPGQSTTITVQVTDGGAGAFSCEIDFLWNEGGTDTITITGTAS